MLLMKGERSINRILISTMPRSGTIFFFDFIAALFGFERLVPTFTGGFRPVPPEWDPYKFDRTYLSLKDGQVICAHYHLNQEIRSQLESDELLGIYLYRDPRDVAVSAALYIKYALTHQFLHPLFTKLTEAEAVALMLSGGIIPVNDLPYETDGKGAPYVIYSGMRYYCDISYPWLLPPMVAKIRYEDFTKNPVETLTRSFSMVGVEVSEKDLAVLAKEKNFTSATGGRSIGIEDKTSHFRKGIVGDYKNYFTDLHRAICKLYIGEDLIRLGYEKDYNW